MDGGSVARSAVSGRLRMGSWRGLRASAAVSASALAFAATSQPPPPPPQAPRSARAAAEADLTGNWVAQITEDWRWRMITPPKGDYASVPLNALGRQVADRWDPAADVAAGEQCRAFGAGGIMRLPTRLKIAWAGDDALRLETDLGQQTRTLRFASPATAAAPSWQGSSVAGWAGVPPTVNPFGALVAPTQGSRCGADG